MDPTHPADVLARERDHEVGPVELVERRLPAAVHRNLEPQPEDRVTRPPAHRHALDDMRTGSLNMPTRCPAHERVPGAERRRSPIERRSPCRA